MPKIVIVGAQGHLGSQLYERLRKNMPKATLVPTADKESTPHIVEDADIILLAVRTGQMDATLKGIAGHLQPHAIVISFVGRYPLSKIAATAQRPAVRAMVDPFWNLLAYEASGGVDSEVMELILAFSKHQPLALDSDDEIEIFTNLLAHLFAVLLLERSGRIQNSDQHLDFLAVALSKLGRLFTPQEFEHYELGDDAGKSLQVIATPGGITEKVVELLNAGAGPEEIQKELASL